MTTLLDETLRHLQALVGFDTRNPPRLIDEGGIFAYLAGELADFDCKIVDHGAGAVSLLAVRGAPTLLFNVHLDTVPDSPAWTASPFALRVDAERAIGLGACDIKGAAAALVAAAQATPGAAAFLFTSDEEANDARCIAAFLADHAPRARHDADTRREGKVSRHRFDAIIVAEPTRNEAVLAHRGMSSVQMRFQGRAAHASGQQTPADNALHQATRWAGCALDHVDALAHERFGGLTGLRFNIGRIEGGIKANVIAPTAELRFGFRPLPSMDHAELLATFRAFADPPASHYAETFHGDPLPAGAVADAETRRLAARDVAEALGLAIGNAVDFWTEAALFSQAGFDTFVYGPGDIAQAHSADEWVALSQLGDYAASIERIIGRRAT